jgi:UDP-glucose 4-epimerase
MTKNILVTGGLGYVGSHTIIELLQEGYRVICLDNLQNSNIDVVKKIEDITNKSFEFYNVNVCDINEINKCLGKNKSIDGIIHFAANKSVSESIQFPIKYYENNIMSLLNIIKIADKFKSNIVFSSSCTVYGESLNFPLTEDDETAIPKSPYGNTKKICEEILFDFSKSEKINITSLRYFNPVGAHFSGKIGEAPTVNPQNLIPYLMETAIGLRDQLVIFGNDYDTFDGTCIRDFIHVSDVATAHIAALKYMDNCFAKKIYNVFNIGRGVGVSIKQVVDRFIDLTGVNLNYCYGNRRSGDIIESWAACEKAEIHLGWKAKYSLDDIINSAWIWQKNILLKREYDRS